MVALRADELLGDPIQVYSVTRGDWEGRTA
jgi:hypothetical protein